MKSRWFELKEEAIKIRKKGVSIGYVEKKLGIPRSTLSGWFKDIQLTKRQKGRLCQNWKNALVKARKKAIVWHNQQKERRMGEARKLALNTLEKIDFVLFDWKGINAEPRDKLISFCEELSLEYKRTRDFL